MKRSSSTARRAVSPNADRWDLRRVFLDSTCSVSLHVVSTEGDALERGQVSKARERLGRPGLDIRVLPGGHMATSEQPEALAQIIQELAPPRATALGSGCPVDQPADG